MVDWLVSLVSSYAGKKLLDQTVGFVKKGIRKESLEHQLINALNKSLLQTCNHFSIDVVMVERSEPFLHNLVNSKGMLSFERIAKTLEQVTGMNFNEEILLFWQESFKHQIIEYEKLYDYVSLYGTDIDANNLHSKISSIVDFAETYVGNIIWHTNPYSWEPVCICNDDMTYIFDVSYKRNDVIHSFPLCFILYDKVLSGCLLDNILNRAKDCNVNVFVLHLLSSCSVELQISVNCLCENHPIAVIWDDATTIKQYIMALHDENGHSLAFESLKKRIIDAYSDLKTLCPSSAREDVNDKFFVDREEEQKLLNESSSLAFFIQGVSLCGKTSLVKRIVALYTKENDTKVFWHTMYDKQEASVLTATFWDELCNFFVFSYSDYKLHRYFENKSHGYHLTDGLVGILESTFRRHHPIIVIDNIHNCREENNELNQVFEIIVTKKLCRIYFIGWHNVLKRSYLADSLIEKVHIKGLDANYLDEILEYYTGEPRPDVAKSICDNLYGLPGYATIYDARISNDSLIAKKDVLTQILNLLTDTEKHILFALSIATTPISRDVFDKLMLLESLDNLHTKNLVDHLSQNYTVHDNYKPFFLECSLDYNTRVQVLSILSEAAKYNVRFYINIINLHLNYSNYKLAQDIFCEKFYDLLHSDYAKYLLSIIHEIEKGTGQRSQIALVSKKIIILERCGEYNLCKNLLEVFENYVDIESNEYEAIFYIKLRCMYFDDCYDEILKLCNKKSQEILKFSSDIRIQVLFMIGRIHYIQGSLEYAYTLYLICFDAAITCENQALVTKAMHRLSMVESCLGHVKEALNTFELMLANSIGLTGRRKSFILYRIAKCCYLLKDFKKAVKFCKKAIVIKESFNDFRGIVFVQKLMAKIYLQQNNMPKAKNHIRHAIKLLKKVQIVKEEIAVNIVAAKIHIAHEEKEEAYRLLDSCLIQSSKMGLKFRIETILDLTKKSDCFSDIYKRAIELQETIRSQNDDENKPSLDFTSLASQHNRRFFDNLFVEGKSNLKNMLLRSGLDELV